MWKSKLNAIFRNIELSHEGSLLGDSMVTDGCKCAIRDICKSHHWTSVGSSPVLTGAILAPSKCQFSMAQ